MKVRKKLIEVALPLDAINAASAREKSIRHGHPSTLHLWWARRPLAAARAVLFAQMVDDPSSRPELFPTEADQDRERTRLFGIIEELVKWENTTNETVLETAREEIRKSWRRTCEDNRYHPHAAKIFDPNNLPAFHDPFAGGGSIPLEAQRLGLEAHASDLNPVAVLINKAMIEIPPRFAGKSPVNPEVRSGKGSVGAAWRGAAGLAEDVRYYGKWMREEAKKRIGHLYPKVKVTDEMARERPDLKQYEGKELTVIAWLWARTVKSPNPAFANVDVPLASTFVLSTKNSKEAYVEPVVEDGGYHFTVKVGKPPAMTRQGTKIARGANFQCVMSKVAINDSYIKAESMAGRMKSRLMAVVAEGSKGRVYLPPTPEQEETAYRAHPTWKPEQPMNRDTTNLVSGRGYGFFTWADLFTDRQLVALTTFSDLVAEAGERVRADALASEMPGDSTPLRDGGTGARAYAEAIEVYLALAIDRMSSTLCTIALWSATRGQSVTAFARQAIPMTWDFPDVNPFAGAAGDYIVALDGVLRGFPNLVKPPGFTTKSDAATQSISMGKLVSTDPPWYDNIGYADLSDFFYVWLRSSLKSSFPDLFATLATPKADELVATPYRHSSNAKAEKFFLDGMTLAMKRLTEQTHKVFPVTIYYAFRQSEVKSDQGIVSTGWETFLDAVVRSGFVISGTWPIRTERPTGMKVAVNALASSIVLVCLTRPFDAPIATRREFVDRLRSELPDSLRRMQAGNIAPVDLAQAAIGPGMAVFTRYSIVLDASGESVSVREALDLINQTLDEVLAEQEGDFDADTRWALAWFEQSGFAEGKFGVAETLSKAKNTSVSGMVEAGILDSSAGTVRLLRPNELPDDWDPERDRRFTIWEAAHHLVRLLDHGETAAAVIMAKIGADAEAARELAYRLYRICDQKGRSQEAQSYNALVQSWPEIARLAKGVVLSPQQPPLTSEDGAAI